MKTIALLFCALLTFASADVGSIRSVNRRAMMLEPDVVIFKSEITYVLPKNADVSKRVYFDHVIPIDYEHYVTDVLARDLTKTNLDIKQTNGPSFEVPELQAEKNVTDYIWYKIDVTEAAAKALEAKEKVIIFETAEYYKRRRLPFPRRISMKDK